MKIRPGFFVYFLVLFNTNYIIENFTFLITWPLLRVLLGELLSVLEKLLLVFGVLLY